METNWQTNIDPQELTVSVPESAVEKHLKSYFPDLFSESGYKKLLSILRFSVESITVDDEVDILSVVDEETKSSMLYVTQYDDSTLISLNPGYLDISTKRKGFALLLAAFHSMNGMPVVVARFNGLEEQAEKAKLFLSFLYNHELPFDELTSGIFKK